MQMNSDTPFPETRQKVLYHPRFEPDYYLWKQNSQPLEDSITSNKDV